MQTFEQDVQVQYLTLGSECAVSFIGKHAGPSQFCPVHVIEPPPESRRKILSVNDNSIADL